MLSSRTKFILAFGLLGICLFLPIIYGQARIEKDIVAGDPWRDVLYDFQTLITGLMAVGAAGFTILTMEKTDQASERRHQELVEIQLRSEFRRMERVLHPQIGDLMDIKVRLSGFLELERDIEPGAGSKWRWMTAAGRRFSPMLEEVDIVLRRAQFVEGVELFDGITTRFFEELTTSVGEVRSALDYHLQMDEISDMNEAEYYYYDESFDDTSKAFQVTIATTLELLSRLIKSLENMESKYKSELQLRMKRY